MTNTWNLAPGLIAMAIKRDGKRLATHAVIVVLGAVVALGMLNRRPLLHDVRPIAEIVESGNRSSLAMELVSPRSVLDSGLDHPRISDWVNRLTTTRSNDFVRALSLKSKYAEMITAKLDAREMPRDLIYLAMIESEFNPTARSSAKAVGLWQFMAGTAREFGLAVSGSKDERQDPDKATDAALTYLSKLHDRFGSWYLAAAAYNSGPGTVSKAMRKVTGRTEGTDADFFRILPVLPRETQDYVPKLIATARVASAPEEYGLTVPSYEDAVKLTERLTAKKAPARKVAAKKPATKAAPAKKSAAP